MSSDTLMQTIQRLKDIALDPNCDYMNKSTVVGYLGEVVVREKLSSKGLVVFHKGNQSAYDLATSSGVKIDVKAGSPRDEFGAGREFWGWALKSQSKKRDINFSRIICVAFTEKYDIHGFYTVLVSNLEHFPPAIPRFKGVERTYNHFERVPVLPPKKIQWQPVYDGCVAALRNGHVRETKPEARLRDSLI